MRHPEQLKEKVRALRLIEGFSLGEIQEITKIPKTTIYKWTREIELSEIQQKRIRDASLQKLQKGRVAVQFHKKKERDRKSKELFADGKREIGGFSKRDLFIAGVALYWAEGFKNKHEHRLGFCNSDPGMIKFYLYWLKDVLGVKEDTLVARLTLNESYKDRTREIELYWSDVTGIPLHQFTKTFYQRTQWKKQYSNNDYYGVLRVHVAGSLAYFLKMKGWIEGLKVSLPR